MLVVHMYMTVLLKRLAGATGVFGQLVYGGVLACFVQEIITFIIV